MSKTKNFDPHHILNIVKDMIREKEIFPLNMLSLSADEIDVVIASFKNDKYYLEKSYDEKMNQYILYIRSRM